MQEILLFHTVIQCTRFLNNGRELWNRLYMQVIILFHFTKTFPFILQVIAVESNYLSVALLRKGAGNAWFKIPNFFGFNVRWKTDKEFWN